MLSSYVENPTDCHFEGQDLSEKILLLLRAHPIANLSWIIPALMLLFLPVFLPAGLSYLGFDIALIPDTYQLVFLIINFLLVSVIVLEGFLNWYFNVYIVTDKNIVDIDFHSILFKNIDIAPLRNVEDVSSSMGGALQAIFHYGDVFVQTAGATKNIDFHAVPQPHQVADFILDHSHRIHQGG